MGKATERLFLPLLRTIIPDIADYDLPMFGAFHNCAFVQIRKEYPLQARRIMHSIWGAGQMAWTKTIVVVDKDVDVHDTPAVLRRSVRSASPHATASWCAGRWTSSTTPRRSSAQAGKIGLDATDKRDAAELHRRHGATGRAAVRGRPIRPGARRGSHGHRGPRQTDARRARWRGCRRTLEAGGSWCRRSKERTGDGARSVKAIGWPGRRDRLPRWTVIVGPDADAANIDDVLLPLAGQLFARTAIVTSASAAGALPSMPLPRPGR
jgi:3-polyprenyl-4-hydroxybenzoate decarboxylase